MDTIKWLEAYAPGFQALSEAKRREITEFLFLWSLFEAKVLNERGSANVIATCSERWARNDHLTEETFGEELVYFRNRYVVNGQFSHHFDQLHLRVNDEAGLVRRVIIGEDRTPANIAAAVLIIVYWFRNNLFHGLKWSYELQGQLENFEHANKALKRAIELWVEERSGVQT